MTSQSLPKDDRYIPDDSDALMGFAMLWNDGQLAADIGTKLTCQEVEAFALCISLGGDFDAAVYLIERHGHDDDHMEGDRHVAMSHDQIVALVASWTGEE